MKKTAGAHHQPKEVDNQRVEENENDSKIDTILQRLTSKENLVKYGQAEDGINETKETKKNNNKDNVQKNVEKDKKMMNTDKKSLK